jgi:murein endopeptidase
MGDRIFSAREGLLRSRNIGIVNSMKMQLHLHARHVLALSLTTLLFTGCAPSTASAFDATTADATTAPGPVALTGATPSEETPIEQQLGPWLDLTGGGIASGPAQTIQRKNPDGTTTPYYGSLANATPLPAAGPGFARLNSPSTSWGTGMMISLIAHTTEALSRDYLPGSILYIGSIAQQFGGPYQPHKSHQNGLDADIIYVGQKSFASVLDGEGHVTNRFETENNWNLWRLFVQQQILQKGQATTVVSMILVAPEIKAYLCAWAKDNHRLDDPLDAEVMRRLRPTVGHDDHFHLRLKCSPHHPDCYQPGDIASGTGCPE